MKLTTRLRCPVCRAETDEVMPVNACVHFHDCASCGTRLRPKPGDCCVFCSYADTPCPPKQSAGGFELLPQLTQMNNVEDTDGPGTD
jgi:hypothetical protein